MYYSHPNPHCSLEVRQGEMAGMVGVVSAGAVGRTRGRLISYSVSASVLHNNIRLHCLCSADDILALLVLDPVIHGKQPHGKQGVLICSLGIVTSWLGMGGEGYL